MDLLNDDVHIHIFSYLQPQDIIASYNSFRSILDHLAHHIGFKIHCKHVVNDNIIKWFEEKQIQLHLLKQYKIQPYCRSKTWLTNGKLHRDNDLPALIMQNNTKIWYQHGKIHRNNDLPAQIWSDGLKTWNQYGLQHRDNDLPAEISTRGTQRWYQYGKLHRSGGKPAITYKDGTQDFYVDGKLIDMNKNKRTFIFTLH